MEDRRLKRTGQVSMYRRPDGYGIITPDDGGREIFFQGKDCCMRRICLPGEAVSFFNRTTKYIPLQAAHVHVSVARGITRWSHSTHLCPCSAARPRDAIASLARARSSRVCGTCGRVGHSFYNCPTLGLRNLSESVPKRPPPFPRRPSKRPRAT